MQTEIVEKIAKLLSGEANQAEINEINAWRNEAAEHERYFNESRECWLLAEETPLSEIVGKNKMCIRDRSGEGPPSFCNMRRP